MDDKVSKTVSTKEVIFENRNRAKIVAFSLDDQQSELLKALQLEEVEALILITGTREGWKKDTALRLEQLFSRGIARAAVSKRALIIDSGISGGVNDLIGQGVADRERKTPLLGVAPTSKVTYPGKENGDQDTESYGLNSNHSHFVLVEGDDWQESAKFMVDLGAAVTSGASALMLRESQSPQVEEPVVIGDSESIQEEGMEPIITDDAGTEPESGDRTEENGDGESSDAGINNGDDTENVIEEEQADEDLPARVEVEEPTQPAAMISRLPAVTILAGGKTDDLSKKEVLYSVRQGWPIIILLGTDDLADEIFKHHSDRQKALTDALSEKPAGNDQGEQSRRLPYIADPDMAEIIVDGKLVFIANQATAEDLRERIIKELPPPWAENVLKRAWERFAIYDKNSNRHRDEYKNLTTRILVLGFLTSLAAILLTWFRTTGPALQGSGLIMLRITVIVLPILTSIGLAIFNGRKADNKWLLLRSSAETLKRKIYAYRVLALYEPRAQLLDLEQTVEDVSQRLMRTDVNEAALHIYDGPIPPEMFGAASKDDGLSPLTPQQYIDIRIGDQISFYQSRTGQKEAILRYYQVAILVIGGLGTFLAAIGAALWVPLTTAAATAITTYLLSEQFQETIVTYNQAETDLLNLELWWQALSPTDKRKPKNIRNLVNTTEALLGREFRGWVQNMQNALSQLRKEISEEEQQVNSSG